MIMTEEIALTPTTQFKLRVNLEIVFSSLQGRRKSWEKNGREIPEGGGPYKGLYGKALL